MNQRELSGLRRDLLNWFGEVRRDLPWRSTPNAYHIWVSEVMLQQTQVTTVIPYFKRFVEKYPNLLTLSAADLQDVLKLWEGLGYYARARNLHRAARMLIADGRQSVPCIYDEFRALPGVGEYIAAAVLSIAFGQPYAALDGNVTRVLARLFAIGDLVGSAGANRLFRERAAALLDQSRAGDHNQAMMELGATVCRPRDPSCDRCPLNTYCEAFATGRQLEFPVKKRKKPIPKYHIAVGVIQKNDRVLITRRKPSGLLGGLWEFPGGKVGAGETPEDACVREIGEEVDLDVEVVDYVTHVDHAYSHFKIGVDVFACRYRAGNVKLQGPVDYRWILVDEIDDYPFPGANHKFLPIVKKRLKTDDDG